MFLRWLIPFTLVGCEFHSPLSAAGSDAKGPPGSTTAVAWWRLDDGIGTTTVDSTDHLAPGTLREGATWTPGRIGPSAIVLDGNGGAVEVGTGASVSGLRALTISAWIRPLSLALPGGDAQRIVAKEGVAAVAGWMLALDGVAQLTFVKHFADRALRCATPPSVVQLDAWQHVAATWDGRSSADAVRIYVDGREVAVASTQDGAGANQSDAGIAILIGNAPSLMRGFAGAVDNVQLYARALDAGEIAILAGA